MQVAFGGRVQQHDLQLYFGPVDAVIGQHYADDPAVEESSMRLSQYSCLRWLKRYPHWYLSVRFMPPAPLPPGVAAHRAAALSEGKDPDIAVRDARAKVQGLIAELAVVKPLQALRKAQSVSLCSQQVQSAKLPKLRQHRKHKGALANWHPLQMSRIWGL